jgi:hypothetical protein
LAASAFSLFFFAFKALVSLFSERKERAAGTKREWLNRR